MKSLRIKIWKDIWDQTNNNVREITKFNIRNKIWGSPKNQLSLEVKSLIRQTIIEEINETT